MGRETIRVDRGALRAFDERTEEADATLLGACDAVEAALATLGAGSDGIDVPGAGAVDAARLHHDRARALGAVFDLVVDRFDRSQLAQPLPFVFAPYGRDVVGPRGGVVNSDANRRWLDAQLRRIRQAPPSQRAQRSGEELRRSLGLRPPRRVRVASHETSWSAAGGVTLGAKLGVVWTIDEFSDGSADVTLQQAQSTGVDYGMGGDLEVDCLDVAVGVAATAGASFGAERVRSWTRSFPSRAAADAFVRGRRLGTVADTVLGAVPLVGYAARWFDGGGMDGAPVRGRSRGVGGAVSGAVGLQPLADEPVVAEGAAAGRLTRAQRTDRRTGVSTDVAVLQGAVGLTATAAGHEWTPGLAYERRVAVARDAEGRPLSLTVTRTWDGSAGQRPPGAAPAAGPAGSAERRGQRGPEADDTVHHYELEVAVDLTEARNADLADRVGGRGPAASLGAADVVALAAAVDDEAVRARSAVTFLDQVSTAAEVCEVGVDGTAGLKVQAGAALASRDRRTVAAWAGTGDRLVQVVGP